MCASSKDPHINTSGYMSTLQLRFNLERNSRGIKAFSPFVYLSVFMLLRANCNCVCVSQALLFQISNKVKR